MEEFKKFTRTNIAEMRPYVKNEDLSGISVSKEDKPWYVARKYFE